MWPFDLILENRVKDLEKSLELTIGYNTVLRNQLERSENREEQLLQKIFELTGINKSPVSSPTHTGEVRGPILIGKEMNSWPKIKENLEVKARQEYWERKQKEKEIQNQNSEKIEQLEKEVEIGL